MTSKTKEKLTAKEVGSRVARWFREMRSELKKVVWPSRKQVINNCAVAIVVMVACGIVIGAFDQLALFIVRQIINLGRLF